MFLHFAIDTWGAVICSLGHGRKYMLMILPTLRRISCHGRNHSQASCEYSLTIFLCCQHPASTRCLVQNLQLICYSQRVNATSQYNDVVVRDVQNGRTRWDGCSGETLLAPSTSKKRLQRKMTKYYHWVGVQEHIGMFSKS